MYEEQGFGGKSLSASYLRFTARFACLLIVLSIVSDVRAQTQDEPGCFSSMVVASTDRPTYSNSTGTTQCGVLEVMGGTDRVWVGRGLHQDDLAQGLQLGFTRSVDLHYSGNVFLHVGDHAAPLSGMGDTYVGARYRIVRQSRLVPSFGAFYTTKVPAASPRFGISTGRYDHLLSLLVSRDFPKVQLDFNLTRQMMGRPTGPGYDRNDAYVLFASVPVMKNLAFVGGGYGFDSLNRSTSAYGVASVGFDWQVAPQLILDFSLDDGLTSGAPRKRFGFGFTYAPANLYALFVHPQGVTR